MRGLTKQSSVSGIYPKKVISILMDYAVLLPLVIWAEFGFVYFYSATFVESIENPLKHYLSATPKVVFSAIEGLSLPIASVDSILTILTIINIKTKRKIFLQEFNENVKNYSSGKISRISIILNILIFYNSFFVLSCAPLVGMKMLGYGNKFSNSAGYTMLAGEMVLLSLFYGNYIFLANTKTKEMFILSNAKKLFINLFTTKKGILFFLRSLANLTIGGMQFYGLSMLICQYAFTISNDFSYVYSGLGAFSTCYRIILTQTIKDYEKVFSQLDQEENNLSYKLLEEKQDGSINLLENKKDEASPNCFVASSLFLLKIGIILSFLVRTLSVPVLFTGSMNNPEVEFDTTALILTILGVFAGAFSAYQYCNFTYSQGKETTSQVWNFFKRKLGVPTEVDNFTSAVLDDSGKENNYNREF